MNSTVKKMYKNNYSKSVVIPMLPTNTGFDWWVEYEANSEVLDRAFSTRFASYNYEPLLDDPEDMDELMVNFKSDVRALFLMNSKKYSELYRIHTVADEDLPISYNYDMTETMDRDTTNQNTITQGARSDTSTENSANTKGQRTDIDNLEVGNQKQSDVNKVTAFNNNNENTNTSMASEVGSRNDIRQFTEGQQTQTMQDQLTFNKGAEIDNSNGSATEDYTLTRKGNIGVQTGADIARIFTDFWNSPKALFYNTIFDDICMMYLNLR